MSLSGGSALCSRTQTPGMRVLMLRRISLFDLGSNENSVTHGFTILGFVPPLVSFFVLHHPSPSTTRVTCVCIGLVVSSSFKYGQHSSDGPPTHSIALLRSSPLRVILSFLLVGPAMHDVQLCHEFHVSELVKKIPDKKGHWFNDLITFKGFFLTYFYLT